MQNDGTASPDEVFPAVTISEVDVRGVRLTVSSAEPLGDAKGTVVLLHGFPEIGYSWRHQIRALAAAGWRVLAPDQRGYGWSDGPEGVEAYRIDELVGDVIGLLDAHAVDEAVVVGHDWGALVTPWVALMRPDRVRGVGLLSVPYVQRGAQSPIDHIRATDPDGEFSYMLAFQEPGIEAMFDADPIGMLRRMYWGACGARPEGYQRGDEPPDGLPPYLNDGEFENYVRAFMRSGFGNPINWYRNLHSNWQTTRPWHAMTLDHPTVFIAGDRDFVATTADGGIGTGVRNLDETCTDLRGVHFIAGAGHWVQQEAPDEVSRLLIDFLEGL